MKKTKILIFIIVIGLLGFIAWKYLNKSNSNSTNEQKTFTAKVEKGTVTDTVEASGQVQTANYLAITTSVNGIVKQVFVKEGDKVVKGQKIMEITLDSEGEKSRVNAYSNYLKAKNSLDSAKTSLYALENSVKQKEEAFNDVKETTSYQTHDERLAYDIAENDYLSAKASLESKQAEISQIELSINTAWLDYQAQAPIITAPDSGTISNVTAVEGLKIENSVTSDRTVATVATIKKEGTPIVSLNVSEIDINSIKVGQKVNLKLSSIENEKFTGSVVGIDKIGSSESGVSNYPVMVKFDKDNDKVLPNMGVDAEIVVDEKADVLYIPSSAVQTTRKGTFVKVTKDGEITETKIEIGISNGSITEIISGLNEGDEVVISALPITGFTDTNSTTQRSSGVMMFGGGNFQRR